MFKDSKVFKEQGRKEIKEFKVVEVGKVYREDRGCKELDLKVLKDCRVAELKVLKECRDCKELDSKVLKVLLD